MDQQSGGALVPQRNGGDRPGVPVQLPGRVQVEAGRAPPAGRPPHAQVTLLQHVTKMHLLTVQHQMSTVWDHWAPSQPLPHCCNEMLAGVAPEASLGAHVEYFQENPQSTRKNLPLPKGQGVETAAVSGTTTHVGGGRDEHVRVERERAHGGRLQAARRHLDARAQVPQLHRAVCRAWTGNNPPLPPTPSSLCNLHARKNPWRGDAPQQPSQYVSHVSAHGRVPSLARLTGGHEIAAGQQAQAAHAAAVPEEAVLARAPAERPLRPHLAPVARLPRLALFPLPRRRLRCFALGRLGRAVVSGRACQGAAACRLRRPSACMRLAVGGGAWGAAGLAQHPALAEEGLPRLQECVTLQRMAQYKSAA